MPKIALAKYLVNFISLLQFALGTIHLRRRQIFTIFDPYPSPIGSFLLLSVSKFGQFLTPPPANILNGWSHSSKIIKLLRLNNYPITLWFSFSMSDAFF